MSSAEFRFPEWQVPLQDCIAESDREQLPEKIQAVESLLFQRLQLPLRDELGHGEHEAINEALTLLRTIKSRKLSFSDWK
jgi:hypothetical protein